MKPDVVCSRREALCVYTIGSLIMIAVKLNLCFFEGKTSCACILCDLDYMNGLLSDI